MTPECQAQPNEKPLSLWINVLEIWVVAFLYGIYWVVFKRSVFILLARIRELERQAILLIVMVALFLLSSAQVFVLTVDAAVVVGQLRMDRAPLLTASLLIYVTSCICSDALLIYRCYVIWNDNPYIVIPPLILLINATAFGYIRNITVFQSISLTTAVSVTLLTASKIAWTAFRSRAFLSGGQKRRYLSASSTILESGALYALFAAIHFAFFVRRSVIAPVFYAAVSQIVVRPIVPYLCLRVTAVDLTIPAQGIAPTMIIVVALLSTLAALGEAALSLSLNKYRNQHLENKSTSCIYMAMEPITAVPPPCIYAIELNFGDTPVFEVDDRPGVLYVRASEDSEAISVLSYA
ncbi:hypothetical protein FB451DRAFT_1448601 [Mycena latifolia]|nr:hypothetical protein FB451DRAFT_1448601 [Mycena latifolia]